MGFDASLYPYTKKWPKKPTIFKVREKDEIDFRNFYDFFRDLREIPPNEVPNTLIVWMDSDAEYLRFQLKSSGLEAEDEEEKLNYWKAGDVARILNKHMKIWRDRLKSNKETTEEESGYYWEYMKKLNRISRMKPSTPLIANL